MNTVQLVQEDVRRVGAELAKVQKILRETEFPKGNLIIKRFKGYKTGMPYVRIYSAANVAEAPGTIDAAKAADGANVDQLTKMADLAEAPEADDTGKAIKLRKADYTEGNLCASEQTKKARDRYIPRAQRDLARQLALKKYYTAKERDLREEYAALSAFARCFRTKGQRTEQLLRKYPEVYALIKDEVNDRNVRARRWSEEAYIGKKNYADELIHETVSRQKVRSKSEVLIANELYYAGIPYRYECQQIIGGVSFYPDFTILNPRTGKVLIWEHFGLATKREYMSDAVHKLAHYAENGLVHGRNFIMTYESERVPLNVSTVRLMIDTYLR